MEKENLTNRILVLGVGNLLMGDEGVGVHAIRALEKEMLPDAVDPVDGGTGGFHLLSYLQDYPIIIMIDATMDGKPPGTVALIEPKFASDFPKALSAHDIGLKDLVESAALLDSLNKIYLVTVSIKTIQNMQIELSPEIKAAIPSVIEKVKELVTTLVQSDGGNSIKEQY